MDGGTLYQDRGPWSWGEQYEFHFLNTDLLEYSHTLFIEMYLTYNVYI